MAKATSFFNLNTALSILDPELRKIAQRLWASIPDNSPIKSELFERAFGVFKSWAETKARDMGVLGDVVEKLTDVGDFAVRGGVPVAKAARDWMDRFYDEAAKRLEKTPADRLQTEFEKIQLEFHLRRELIEAIEAAKKEAKGPAKPEKPLIDWEKMQDRFERLLLGFAKTAGRIDGWAANTAAPAVHRFRQFLETKGVQR